MKVVVTGSSGLVGSALVPHLRAEGHEVLRLVRGRALEAGEVSWDPKSWKVDTSALAGCEAVIHLAGAPIAEGRWTAARKELIRQSRVDSTRFLAQTLAALAEPPKVLISASAIGFYGDRGEDELDEDSPVGFGFLAEVCRQWEAAAEPASKAGIRVVHPRLGMVLTGSGGALGRMLLPFRLGLGGVLGSGEQWVSFIHLEDVLHILSLCLRQENLEGPLNVVAPEPIRQRDFAAALASALHRPAFLRTPGFVLAAMLGEMAEELLLASARVLPRRLLAASYAFRSPNVEKALHDALADS